jgi:hypothetical protein
VREKGVTTTEYAASQELERRSGGYAGPTNTEVSKRVFLRRSSTADSGLRDLSTGITRYLWGRAGLQVLPGASIGVSTAYASLLREPHKRCAGFGTMMISGS